MIYNVCKAHINYNVDRVQVILMVKSISMLLSDRTGKVSAL